MKTTSPFTPELLQRLAPYLDRNGPRYTSYPTADRLHDGFGEAQYRQALAARGELSRHQAAPPLALYLHLPFCESVCYYCACNKVVTRHHERAGEYLDALEREVGLVAAALGAGEHQRVTQVHFGGGTPTFLSDAELTRLWGVLARAFDITPDAECSIEVDPRTADAQRLAHLRALGFNRVSFGVQDFDAAVQQAVHRVQPFEQVRALIDGARALGFESINADLIYGLPRQTPASFERTIELMATLAPDRIALYGYAHLPSRFKPQRRIVAAELPDGSARLAMLGHAIQALGAAGYDYIGMDHFALAHDALAVAKREGRLHRNFQGYTTQPECDLIGLGVSAIGSVGATLAQNAKTLDGYYGALNAGHLATERGRALDSDDLLRRAIVMGLMCRGRLDFAQIEAEFGIAVPAHFGAELQQLDAMAQRGLLRLDERGVELTADGWSVVRAVAMVFDRYLAGAPPAVDGRFSRLV
jgi:oxygen-independent coproporphyrinogen-3 oxidase